MKAISNILFFVSLILFASPISLYWWIHSSYERYIWIINLPYPLSHFGSFGYQVILYGSLLLIGVGIVILAIGLRSSQRIALILGTFIISVTLIGFSVFLSFPDNLEVRKPDWYQETAILQKVTDLQLAKLGVATENIPEGWYPHRLNAGTVLLTKQQQEKIILGTEIGSVSGGSILVYTLPITTAPKDWVAQKTYIDLGDVLVQESEWKIVHGNTVLHTVHYTPANTVRTDYIFTDDTIFVLSLSPFNENEVDFDVLVSDVARNVSE